MKLGWGVLMRKGPPSPDQGMGVLEAAQPGQVSAVGREGS